jgi:putative sigma-54 modulation protein
MQIEVRGHALRITKALREYAQRRIDFALDRFRPRVARVTVRLTDSADGHEEGMTCSISASGSGLPPHIISVRGGDLYSAIDIAAGRLGRQVARTLDRRTTSMRMS